MDWNGNQFCSENSTKLQRDSVECLKKVLFGCKSLEESKCLVSKLKPEKFQRLIFYLCEFVVNYPQDDESVATPVTMRCYHTSIQQFF